MLYHKETKHIFRLLRAQETLRNRLKNNASQKFVEQLAHGTSTKQDATKAKRLMTTLQGFLNNMKLNAKKIDLLFFHKLNIHLQKMEDHLNALFSNDLVQRMQSQIQQNDITSSTSGAAPHMAGGNCDAPPPPLGPPPPAVAGPAYVLPAGAGHILPALPYDPRRNVVDGGRAQDEIS